MKPIPDTAKSTNKNKQPDGMSSPQGNYASYHVKNGTKSSNVDGEPKSEVKNLLSRLL